jgi:RNA polymerase sigma-70 factor (ECF subfamily)
MNEAEAWCGGGRAGLFQTTQWSLIAVAGGPAGADPDDAAAAARRREAMGVLLHRYLPALRAHLLARGHPADAADDLLQGFVADRVIGRDLLAHADRRRGRFRSFLLASLDHFAANARRADRAAKRAPADGRVLAIDAEAGVDPADDSRLGATDAFDVAWARAALAEALRRTRADCVGCGRPDLWDVFEARVLAPVLDDADPASYDVLAERHAYGSWKRAANALVTAKRRFAQALRAVVAEHAADEAELDRELAALGAALAAAPRADADGRDTADAGRLLRAAAGRAGPDGLVAERSPVA